MKKRVVSIVLILILYLPCMCSVTADTGLVLPAIPAHTEMYKGKKYTLFESALKWHEARDFCHLLGGHLATITSQEEQDFILTLVNWGSLTSYWLGATDEEQTGIWSWITEEAFEYENWDEGEPNNNVEGNEVEHYLVIRSKRNIKKEGSWNDASNQDNNEATIGFVCEWDDAVSYKECRYRSDLLDSNKELSFSYSDKFFIEKDGYTYNHELARASLALELSSWTAKGKEEGSTNEKMMNINSLYGSLGFDKNSIEPHNYDDPLSDNSDKVAYSFATKELYDGSTLVAVVVRGGGYGAEWRSNVHVGSGDMHYGFQLPALNVYADLLEYTKDIDKSNLKLWITGYSRGAAVANILSGRINEDNLIAHKNLYSYLFAVPKGVKVTENDANNSMHNNIYNIVLPYDVVPTLAFEKWGFGRYGQTLMVKNIQWNLSEYQQGGHEKYFREFTGRVYSLGPSVSRAAVKASNAICNFAGNQTEYATVLQGFFMDVVEWAMCRKHCQPLSEFINERYSVGDAVWQKMKNLAADYILHSDSLIKFVGTDKIRLEDVICLMYLNGIDVYNDVYDNVYGKIGKAIKVINTSILNVGDTTEAHNPEYYIAWLYGYDEPRYIYDSETCKKITIACPVNVKVYDSAGNLVASVVNNEVVVDILPIDVIGESAEIYFYEGEDIDDYTIEIEAYDGGNVNYSVTEYENNGVETRKINYANIPVSTGTKLCGNVPKGQKLEAELYNLTSVTDGEETSVAFTDDLTGEDLQNLTVDVTVEGDGVANDVYFATKGELVTLEANPYHDASFIGWYNENDELISENEEYSFILSQNMKVTAKFTKCTAVIFTKTPKTENNLLSVDGIVSSAKDINEKFIIAIYSEEDKLLAIKISDVALNGNTEKEIYESFDTSAFSSVPSYVKLFLWKGFDDLIPLCNYAEADIQ